MNLDRLSNLTLKIKKPANKQAFIFIPRRRLTLPHINAVPSALKSLTSVFGMGTGVTSSLLSPKENFLILNLSKPI